MTKLDLIKEIENETGISRDKVSAVVEVFMETTKKAVADGDTVWLRGFGSFGSKLQRAKLGQDIRKGTPVNIPERLKPYFLPSKTFINDVRRNK